MINRTYSTRKLPNLSNSSSLPINLTTSQSHLRTKFLVSDTPFQIEPPEIQFVDVVPGQIYEITLSVRNLTKKPQRFRVIPPSRKLFQLVYNIESSIAAGLTNTILVSYECKSQVSLRDRIRIIGLTEHFEAEVPIEVACPMPLFIYQPYINFGFVKSGKQKVEEILFKNEGKVQGEVKLSIDGESLFELVDSSLAIRPGEEKKARVRFCPKEPGNFKALVQVAPPSKLFGEIELSATSLQFTKFVIDNDGRQITYLNFPTVYIGQSCKVAYQLINNSPARAKWRASVKRIGSKIEFPTPSEMGKEETERVLICEPLEGLLHPYSKQPIRFTWKGKAAESQYQAFQRSINSEVGEAQTFSKDSSYNVFIEFDNVGEDRLVIPVVIRCVLPSVRISCRIFVFGDCAVGGKKEIGFEISNLNTMLPLSLKFSKALHFQVKPSKVSLEPNGTVSLTAVFSPKVIGHLHESLSVSIVEGLVLSLKMIGEAHFPNNNPLCKVNPNLTQILGESSIAHVESTQILPAIKYKTNLRRQDVLAQFRKKRSEVGVRRKTTAPTQGGTQEQDKNVPPSDLSFDLKELTRPREMQMRLPKLQDLVVRQTEKEVFKSSEFNPMAKMRKLHEHPKNNNQERNCSMDLTPEVLRQIEVGPREVDFGRVFVFSEVTRVLHLVNHSEQHISVRLLKESLHEEMRDSFLKTQILGPGVHAGIEIRLQPTVLGPTRHVLKYIINSKHVFQFLAVYECTPVYLSLSRSEVKIVFSEEDVAFTKQQRLTLSNGGSGQADFSWVVTKELLFTVTPQSGSLRPGEEAEISITYSPSQSTKEAISSLARTEEQRLRLKVTNGVDQILRCVGQIFESKIVSKQSEYNLKEVSVNKNVQVKIAIKNVSKAQTVLLIKKSKSLGMVRISSAIERVLAEETREFTADIYTEQPAEIEGELTFVPRAGKEIKVALRGRIIQPEVLIVEEEVDFGAVTVFGDPAVRPVTIRNLSPVDVDITTYYEDPSEKECLEVAVPDENEDNISMSLRENENESNFKLPARSTTVLMLKFTPREIKTYELLVPLKIATSKGFQPTLRRRVVGRGIKPVLVVEPARLDFGRLIISGQEYSQKVHDLNFINPSEQPIEVSFDESQQLTPFQIVDKAHVIPPNSEKLVRFLFKPYSPGHFEKDLPVLVKGQNEGKSYLTIHIVGSADFPKIMFDRREIILPTVPLGTESKVSFKIYNDGYENLHITHNIVQELTNIPVFLRFPEGANLGVTKKSLRVEAGFIYKKPVSFTLKLEFIDDSNRVYSISISGTTDNSILTLDLGAPTRNFALQRGEYFSRTPQELDSDCAFMCRYLNNTYFVGSPIKEFPGTVVAHEGEQLIELVNFFVKGEFRKKGKMNNKKVKVKALWKCYSQIIRVLKLEGAMLNNMRPQFLLSRSDFLLFYQELQLGNYKEYQFTNTQLIPELAAAPDFNFEAVHREAWVTLVYQIFRLYVVGSVNSKTFLNTVIVGLPKPTLPEDHTRVDEAISESEKLLLHWLDVIYQSDNGSEARKPSYSTLNDCEHLAAAISKYSGVAVLGQYGRPPKTQEEKLRRCEKVVEGLSRIGLNNPFTAKDILSCKPKEMVLLVTHLFSTLPNYIPKQPIVFSCQLGQSQIKSIEITNPSRRPISYWAKIEGSKDFQIESEDNFQIQPKKSYFFKVRFTSKLSIPSEAILSFTSKKDSAFVGALVFNLRSNIVGRNSQRIWNISSPLYEINQFTIPIENNLSGDVDFVITVNNDQLHERPDIAANFIVRQQRVRIKKGQSEMVQVVFVPLFLGLHRCVLGFVDTLVGQIQHQILAQVDNPLVSNQLLIRPPQIYVEQSLLHQVTIPPRNQNLLKAIRYLQTLDKKKRNYVEEQQSYQLEVLSTLGFFSLQPNSLRMGTWQDEKRTKQEQPRRRVNLRMNFKVPAKQFVTYLLVRSADSSDIRKYKIVVNSIFKPIKISLQVKCALKGEVTQPIPLVNSFDKEVTFSYCFTQDSGKTGDLRYYSNFQVLANRQVKDSKDFKEVVVGPNSTHNLSLVFRPKALWQPEGKLVISNLSTSEQFQYEIKGIVEDNSTSHNVDIKCSCGEAVTKTIDIANPTGQSLRYRVSSNSQILECPPTFNILPNGTESYSFVARPLRIGVTRGKIEFKEEDNKLSYNIQVHSQHTPASGHFQIVAKERESAYYQFKLINPLKQAQRFTVVLEGENLYAPQFIDVGPGNSQMCRLEYRPFAEGHYKGRVSVFAPKIAEHWYDLSLSCHASSPIRVPQFKVQLGSTSHYKVQISNPYPQEITVKIRKTNPYVFYTEPEELKVPAQGSNSLKIVYSPSSLQMQSGEVILTTSRIGSWKYLLYGMGVPPTEASEVQVESLLHDDKIVFINFKNPFKNPIELTIELEDPNEGCFKVIVKNQMATIAQNGTFQIPLVFTPHSMRTHYAKLRVFMNQKITWLYPIKGIVKHVSDRPPKVIRSRCREYRKEHFDVTLFGLPQSDDLSSKRFRCEYRNFTPEQERLLSRCLHWQVLNDRVENAASVLAWMLKFNPLKPFKAYGDLSILDEDGNSWLFKVAFQGLQPLPDDFIRLESAIQSRSAVSFRLTNRNRETCFFKAYFTSDSDLDFFVHPSQGELEPFGKEGTLFTVSFVPTEYKKIRKGKLIIETEEMYWSYSLEGLLPKYVPPRK